MSDKPQCGKCGHSDSLYDNEVCIKSTGLNSNCGCRCVFPPAEQDAVAVTKESDIYMPRSRYLDGHMWIRLDVANEAVAAERERNLFATAAVEGVEDSKDSVKPENSTVAASVVVDKDSSVSADLQLAKEDYAYALGFAEGLGLGTYEEMIRLHWKTDGLHIDDYTQHYKDKLGAVERQRVEALRVMRQAKKSSEASSNPERGQDGPASLPESSLPTTAELGADADLCIRKGCAHFEDDHVFRYCTVADCDCRKFVGRQER